MSQRPLCVCLCVCACVLLHVLFHVVIKRYELQGTFVSNYAVSRIVAYVGGLVLVVQLHNIAERMWDIFTCSTMSISYSR